jgi:hypothetical protein
VELSDATALARDDDKDVVPFLGGQQAPPLRELHLDHDALAAGDGCDDPIVVRGEVVSERRW